MDPGTISRLVGSRRSKRSQHTWCLEPLGRPRGRVGGRQAAGLEQRGVAAAIGSRGTERAPGRCG